MATVYWCWSFYSASHRKCRKSAWSRKSNDLSRKDEQYTMES